MKLLSLNIEGDNHYDTIAELFAREQPDCVCLQEVFRVDVPRLEAMLAMSSIYLPLQQIVAENPYRLAPKGEEGIAIFSRLPFIEKHRAYYESEPVTAIGDSSPNVGHRGILAATITSDSVPLTIATTHFTWSSAGSVTPLQEADLANLLAITSQFGQHVLCGDFNAPRGRKIFDTLAQHYTDNIPATVTTTIDQHLHRVSGIQYVVDGLFSTPQYLASDVRVIDGVSDHCAIVAMITVQ